ncbi:hypothetical protein Tco_0497064 [Tanacetum coccineum]
MNVSNSIRVGSSNSVRMPKSKDTKSKNKVLINTNTKSSAAYVRKMPSSVRIDSNKRTTKNLNECPSNASVLNTKNVTAVNDGSNIVCVSCGKDVFMHSHEKCVARYALSRDSRELFWDTTRSTPEIVAYNQRYSGANERPPMLERENYIPWESRFRRFLDNKLEEGEQMWNSIQNGPYVTPMTPDPDGAMNINGTVKQILEPLSKMTEGNKKQYIADVKVMNYLL